MLEYLYPYLKKGDLYKITFTEEKYTGFYDNAITPFRIRILSGRGDYCIVLFRGFTTHDSMKPFNKKDGDGNNIAPIWDIVVAPWKVEGSPLLAWGNLKKIEPFDKENLSLHVNDYTTKFYIEILSED